MNHNYSNNAFDLKLMNMSPSSHVFNPVNSHHISTFRNSSTTAALVANNVRSRSGMAEETKIDALKEELDLMRTSESPAMKDNASSSEYKSTLNNDNLHKQVVSELNNFGR